MQGKGRDIIILTKQLPVYEKKCCQENRFNQNESDNSYDEFWKVCLLQHQLRNCKLFETNTTNSCMNVQWNNQWQLLYERTMK